MYPKFLTTNGYAQVTNHIYSLTKSINCIFILISVGILLKAFWDATRLYYIRSKYICLFLSFGVLSIAYLFFISSIPCIYLNISKISNTYMYRPLYLKGSIMFYRYFPYCLVLAIALLLYASYHISKLNKQMALKKLSISKEISASETTSKIFCHYIKNEILALQAQIEMLSSTEKDRIVLDDLKKRCNLLYTRIDELHHNTRTGELHMEECSIQDIINNALAPYYNQSSKHELITYMPQSPVTACVDPHYMIEAIDNILQNAVEAMDTPEVNIKQLSVCLKTLNDWIIIEISDTGIGISSKNLNNIFTPFYSSHPYSKHWGIGLSLTYKIIRAHEGNIEVDSELGKGTIAKILLPLLKSKLTS